MRDVRYKLNAKNTKYIEILIKIIHSKMKKEFLKGKSLSLPV